VGFVMNILPMNVFPLILVILYENANLATKYLNFDIASVITPCNFLFMIAALLLFTLSYEMIKAAMFAPKGSGTWVDFIMSFLLLLGIILYIAHIIMQLNSKPSKLLLLIAEAQMLDVMVGFYLAITNARRDFNTGG
jgi:vacuolar-type H+-ATPase subunit I/STV1